VLIALVLTSLVLLLYAAPELPGLKALHRFLVVRPAPADGPDGWRGGFAYAG
jgi:hypothetical protein